MNTFSIERGGQIINDNVQGFFCDNGYPDSIQIVGAYLAKIGDILHHKETGQAFVIDKIEPLSSTAILHYRSPSAAPSISIGTIAGNAIVGNQQNATINGMSYEEICQAIANLQGISEADRKKLNDLAASVDSVVKAGLLERFSPILAAVLQPITAWLLPK